MKTTALMILTVALTIVIQQNIDQIFPNRNKKAIAATQVVQELASPKSIRASML